jgi:group I intron endonuclease
MWIYEILNTSSNRVYIGQTIRGIVKIRWNDHVWKLNNNIHSNKYLQEDWNKFGKNIFKFNVIKKCESEDELDNLEKLYIKEYKNKNLSYNISDGGQQSKVAYYKKWYGLISPTGVVYKNIENMEKFARLYNLDADKLRQVSMGKRYSYKGWKTLSREKKSGYAIPVGHKMSLESSLKKSKSLKLAYAEGRKVAGEHSKKTYSGIISPDGKIYTNITGLSGFCREHGLSKGNMSDLCSGKIKQYKGWTYNPSVTTQEI